MAVVQAIQFRIIQGKNQEFMANVAEARKIQEGLGGRVRAWQATMAGPNSGIVTYTIEHDDLAAFAAFSDKLQADSDWLAFVARTLGSANPTGTFMSAVLANEIV